MVLVVWVVLIHVTALIVVRVVIVMGPFFAVRQERLFISVHTRCHYLFILSVCVTFVVFTDCESRTRPISTIPGCTDAGKHGLTRGTCFVVYRMKVVAVAGLLWISWCYLGAVGFCFFFFLFFFERTRPAASMRPPCLIYLSLSNEAKRGGFLPISYRCVHGAIIYLFCLVCMYKFGRFYWLRELY